MISLCVYVIGNNNDNFIVCVCLLCYSDQLDCVAVSCSEKRTLIKMSPRIQRIQNWQVIAIHTFFRSRKTNICDGCVELSACLSVLAWNFNFPRRYTRNSFLYLPDSSAFSIELYPFTPGWVTAACLVLRPQQHLKPEIESGSVGVQAWHNLLKMWTSSGVQRCLWLIQGNNGCGLCLDKDCAVGLVSDTVWAQSVLTMDHSALVVKKCREAHPSQSAAVC